jgi:hypothetical protein
VYPPNPELGAGLDQPLSISSISWSERAGIQERGLVMETRTWWHMRGLMQRGYCSEIRSELSTCVWIRPQPMTVTGGRAGLASKAEDPHADVYVLAHARSDAEGSLFQRNLGLT